MGRYLAGVAAALLLTASALFWWQSRSQAAAEEKPPTMPVTAVAAIEVPSDGDPDAIGDAPPMPPGASPQSREQRRFARYDRNRDGIITRTEMLSTRTKGFRALDTDGNNLLSFEEWAVATGDRFAASDLNKDGKVTPAEFAATAPKPKPKAACRC